MSGKAPLHMPDYFHEQHIVCVCVCSASVCVCPRMQGNIRSWRYAGGVEYLWWIAVSKSHASDLGRVGFCKAARERRGARFSGG